MSQLLRKRSGEAEGPSDYIEVQEPKRFHGEEREQFLQLVQLDQTLADDEVECAYSEELVNGVMRSLEEDIAATCCTSNPVFNSTENSVAFDISIGNEDQIRDSDDLCYLLEASDDELGIPPSPALMLKDEVCISSKETWDGLSENCNLKSLGGNWHFEDDFENYQQFALYEKLSDTLQLEDYMDRDFLGQPMIFDGDFPTTWELETCSSM